jgi:flagellar protein FlaJ
MTKEVDKLKKLLEEEKKKPKKKRITLERKDDVDTKALSKIVSRMRDKYIEEGILTEGAAYGKSKRLKALVEGPSEMKIKTGSPHELLLFDSAAVRWFGKFYMHLQSPLSFLSRVARRNFGRRLERNLLAAGMEYSVDQYLSLVVSISFLLFLFTAGIMVVLYFLDLVAIIAAIALSLVVPFFVLMVSLIIPSSRAKKRALGIDKQLPFALRHMSIEIRAGVGIYKTMESVANSDYGVLSDGIHDVLANIEKGVPTEEALEMWAASTRSDGLRRMVSHLVRALRTGGNLSEIMITIAEDVSFERKMRIADYAEKLNLMSLFLMMAAIVFPVMITVLTSVGSNEVIQQYVSTFAIFSPMFLMLVYFVICPALIFIFIYFVRAADPG